LRRKNSITLLVEQQGLSETLIEALRERFPGRHFTYCMDDDISVGRPVIERRGFRLYLVDSRDHCSSLTTDADHASGVVLAEVITD
jgi:Family of unknown function (DUF6129)